MTDQAAVLSDQLGRMRGMTRFYHERFFADTRFVTVAVISLFVAGWAFAPEAFLLIPVAALIGANQTAFDASYLIFARSYAERLETAINEAHGMNGLVASRLEDTYLFPLRTRKVVTVPLTGNQTWFSWMTIFYTLAGMVAAGFGLALGWPTLESHGAGWVISYTASLGLATFASLGLGYRWFVSGEGEARLQEVLNQEFDTHPSR